MYIFLCRSIFRLLLYLIISSRTHVLAAAPLKLCQHSQMASNYNFTAGLRAHGYTNRGIEAFSENCHPLIWRLIVNMTNSNHRPIEILEVGCGNGRALLNLQFLFKNQARLTCLNKGGYRYPQANSNIDIVRLALHSNLSLYCDSMTNKPLVPEVHLTNLGLGKEPLPSSLINKFDFVYSQYALDIG